MKLRFLLIIMASLLIFSQCKKDSDKNNDLQHNGNSSLISIKGKLNHDKKAKTDSLSLSDAKKVLLFSKYYYSLKEIVNDTFSINAFINSGVSLIFLTEDNRFIGVLSTRGLNVLPLGGNINGGHNIIDLSTLTFVGKNVIPSHDPLGNEIQLNETEIASLKAIGSYFEDIAENIDADSDGIPDVISERQLTLFTQFTIYGGKWGLDDKPAEIVDSTHYYVNYMLEVGCGKGINVSNGNISFSGPLENPYSDIMKWWWMGNPDTHRSLICTFCRETNADQNAPWGSAFLPFRKGTYQLTINNNETFRLKYSNIDIKYSLFIVVPTLHTNSEGLLTSITFEYRLPNGTIINPDNLITNVMIQLSDNTMHQFYVNDHNKLNSSTGFAELIPDTPVDISSLHDVMIWYDDLLGNSYDIEWR